MNWKELYNVLIWILLLVENILQFSPKADDLPVLSLLGKIDIKQMF